MAREEMSPMLEWTTARIGGVELRLAASEAGIRSIEFSPDRAIEGHKNSHHPLLAEAERQLLAYFAGDLRDFDLPLDMAGTPFQQRVWRALLKIPYGRTRSYSEIARGIGAPSAVRAVGAANGANPIAIVVPCHRVIGASGSLVGYGGGLPLKQRLLALERGSLFDAYES
jgi:methylated-DNA-[protein]-cysteine S-methyltransferase